MKFPGIKVPSLSATVVGLNVFVLIAFPLVTRWWFKTVDIEELLIFCAGLSNLVAIIDISRTPQLVSDEKAQRRTRLLLTAQLFFLACIIGGDVSNLVSNDAVRLSITCVLLVSVIFSLAFLNIPLNVRTGWLTFGIVVCAATHALPAAVDKLGKLVPQAVNWIPVEGLRQFLISHSAFVSERGNAWVHLLFIPILYLFVDSRLRKVLPISASAIALDVALLIVGLACVSTGLRAADPRFEAGASAAVLLLGNWVYVIYIGKKVGEPPSPTPQTAPLVEAAVG